jgi:DNA-binding NarL/FixJ family response regulator
MSSGVGWTSLRGQSPNDGYRGSHLCGADPGAESGRGGPNWAGDGSAVKPASGRLAGQDPIPLGSVLIIDDYKLYRENLVDLLALSGRYTPIAAWDLPSLVLALDHAEPIVALLNLATRGSSLLLRAVKDMAPNLRSIVLGANEEDEPEIVACAEAGVTGYHMRSDSLPDLLGLIDSVATGKTGCPPRVAAILLRRVSALAAQSQPAGAEIALTAREAQILQMLELGHSNRDIAAQLSIAVYTVKNHVHSLLTKLGVSTRTEAAALSRSIRANRY